MDGWVDWMGGWMDGWMDGGKSWVKDCLQQSKIKIFPTKTEPWWLSWLERQPHDVLSTQGRGFESPRYAFFFRD